MKVFPSVGVVVFDEDKVLLVVKANHPNAAYQLPGGQIEPGESDVDAASRELSETTGLHAKAAELIKIQGKWEAVIEKDYGKALFPMACFRATDYTGQIAQTPSARPEWVEISRLKDLTLNPNTAEVIAAAV
jgi:ADP-ribose pyrophosphatase YjhB (NUDIX family)